MLMRGRSHSRVGAYTPGWTPAALDPLAWYRADLGVTAPTGRATSWADQGGRGNHLSQGTDALRPTPTTAAGLRGRAVLSFDGGDIMVLAGVTMPRTMAVFAVIGGMTSRGMLIEHGLNTGFYLYTVGAASVAVFGATGVGYHRVRENPNVLWGNANSQFSGSYDGTSFPVMRANRAAVASTLDEGTAQAALNVTADLNVGARSGPAIGFTGEIAELIILDRFPTTLERNTIEAYQWEWFGV